MAIFAEFRAPKEPPKSKPQLPIRKEEATYEGRAAEKTPYTEKQTSSEISKKEGPGVWFALKTLAKKATTKERFNKWVEDVIDLISNLRCLVCREHALEYLDKNPPHRAFGYTYKGQEMGAFRWVWNFHNTVNVRLGKPLLDFESAVSLYYDEASNCSSTCGI